MGKNSAQSLCLTCNRIAVVSFNSLKIVVWSLCSIWIFGTPMHCSTPGFLTCTVSQSLLNVHCRWCHQTISSSVAPFSSYLLSFPASESLLISGLFALGGQIIGASVSASVFPMNIQDRFPLELTGLISLQSKGLSKVFSSTTIWKQQLFDAQPSWWSNPQIHTWLLEKP